MNIKFSDHFKHPFEYTNPNLGKDSLKKELSSTTKTAAYCLGALGGIIGGVALLPIFPIGVGLGGMGAFYAFTYYKKWSCIKQLSPQDLSIGRVAATAAITKPNKNSSSSSSQDRSSSTSSQDRNIDSTDGSKTLKPSYTDPKEVEKIITQFLEELKAQTDGIDYKIDDILEHKVLIREGSPESIELQIREYRNKIVNEVLAFIDDPTLETLNDDMTPPEGMETIFREAQLERLRRDIIHYEDEDDRDNAVVQCVQFAIEHNFIDKAIGILSANRNFVPVAFFELSKVETTPEQMRSIFELIKGNKNFPGKNNILFNLARNAIQLKQFDLAKNIIDQINDLTIRRAALEDLKNAKPKKRLFH